MARKRRTRGKKAAIDLAMETLIPYIAGAVILGLVVYAIINYFRGL